MRNKKQLKKQKKFPISWLILLAKSSIEMLNIFGIKTIVGSIMLSICW